MSATRLKQAASATLEPPNLWTTQGVLEETDMGAAILRDLSAQLYRPGTRSRKLTALARCVSARLHLHCRALMDFSALWPLLLVLLVAGMVAGVVAGLLGVGGGIVLVPVLEYSLRFIGIPPAWCMHVAVATSLAAIIPTSISSSRAHHARGAVDWGLAKAWAPGMLLGGLLGSLVAASATGPLLTGIFGVMAGIVAVKMFLPLDHLRIASQVPRGGLGNLIAGAIGTVSAMMGIGGGTLSVPVMSLTGEPVHRAVGTAAFFGLLLALPGTLGYLLATPPITLPGLTLGWVSLAALLIVAPASAVMAPYGARLAHSIDKRRLSKLFGLFLCLVSLRMLYRTFISS